MQQGRTPKEEVGQRAPQLLQLLTHNVYKLLEVISSVRWKCQNCANRVYYLILNLTLFSKVADSTTSPNMRMSVTDTRIAAQGGTSLSKNMGSDYKEKTHNVWLPTHRTTTKNTNAITDNTQTSIAKELPIKSVQSKRC